MTNDKQFQVNGATLQTNDQGLSPIELISSSLGLCVFISMNKLFDRDEVDVDREQLEVKVLATKAEGAPSRIESFQVKIKFPDGLEPTYKRKLAISAEKACTIGNTIQRGAEIKVVEI
ncbi:hypothetical protein AB990_16020 [Alkalihalobacillus pseudalcaliphilus]|nr:hypothetical protein AB990_16020 [Alkalihalobacillus pseudalcaliphilus]